MTYEQTITVPWAILVFILLIVCLFQSIIIMEEREKPLSDSQRIYISCLKEGNLEHECRNKYLPEMNDEPKN